MKKGILFALLFGAITIGSAQKLNQMINLEKYTPANKEWKESGERKISVVFIGNSITEGWVRERPDFFFANNYVGRGISGQTSPQLLLRFRSDVIELKPEIVVINVGTNDIAENSGSYKPEFTLGNIVSMTELAQANGIKVILSSVLPAGGFSWNSTITDTPKKIDALNMAIKAYARKKKLQYIDYNSNMRKNDGSMTDIFSRDGVHPVAEGYIVMEALAKRAILNEKKHK